MTEVITGEFDARKIGENLVDKSVPNAEAESLSSTFFTHALMNPEENCWLLAHTIVPRSILNEDLQPFFNSMSDGKVAVLPDEFQKPDTGRVEVAMKQGDNVLLQNCALPVPMS